MTNGTSGHVCIVTSAHPLDDVRVYTKFAQSFLDNGWRVSWVGPDISVHQTSELDPRISYHLAPKIRGRLDRLRSARRLPSAASGVEGVDWWYSPDPDAARVAIRLAKNKGGRAVFDIHEVFHGYHLQKWTFGRDFKFLSRMVRARIRSTCDDSDLVIAIGKTVLNSYTTDIETPTLLVRNCAPSAFADASDRQAHPKPQTNSIRVMHGKAALANGTPVVFEALRQFARPNASIEVLMFEGAGNSPFSGDLGRVTNPSVQVTRLNPVPHSEVPAITASCDLGLIANDRLLAVVGLPNRLFEYMAAGIAVLAPVYAPEIKQVVDTEQIGVTVDFENAEAVARSLEWFVDNPDETRAMGARARAAFLRDYTWESEFGRLLQIMQTPSR